MVSKSLGGVGGTTALPDAEIPFSGLERTIVTQNGNSRAVAVAVLMAGNGGGDGADVSTRLLSGGNVDWETGFTFRVSAAIYTINGILYSSAEQVIVLDAADGGNPRIDVIALDTNGTVVKITGTPAAAAARPDVDPSLYLDLTFVTVPTGATAPPATDTGGGAGSGIVNVYTENAEWAAADFGGAAGFNYASLVNPHGGTKCIRTGSWTRGRGFRLDKGANVQTGAYQSMRLFLQTNGTRWGTGRIQLSLRNAAGTQVGSTVTIQRGSLGFNDLIATYQQISIPLSSFRAAATAEFRYIQAVWAGNDGHAIAIDDWTLTPTGTTGSTSGGTTSGMTQAQADARYQPLLAVNGSGSTGYTFALADANAHRRFTAATAIAATVPPNSSVAYPIGTRIRCTAAGAGQVTLTPGAGVTLNSRLGALKSAGQFAVFEIEKVAADVWDVLGDVTT